MVWFVFWFIPLCDGKLHCPRFGRRERCAISKHMVLGGKLTPPLSQAYVNEGLTWKLTNRQWVRGQLTIWPLKGIKNKTNQTPSCHTCANLQLKHKCTGISLFVRFPNNRIIKMEKILSKEERAKIDALLEKTLTKERWKRNRDNGH